MTKDQIRAIFLGAGFTIKEGQTDFRPYVYDAAYALLSASIADTAGAIPEGWKLVPIMPTLGMQYAAIDTGCCTRPTDAYAAMLEAAPRRRPSRAFGSRCGGASEFREVGVWEPDGSKFKTYAAENLNGKAMFVKESK